MNEASVLVSTRGLKFENGKGGGGVGLYLKTFYCKKSINTGADVTMILCLSPKNISLQTFTLLTSTVSTNVVPDFPST